MNKSFATTIALMRGLFPKKVMDAAAAKLSITYGFFKSPDKVSETFILENQVVFETDGDFFRNESEEPITS